MKKILVFALAALLSVCAFSQVIDSAKCTYGPLVLKLYNSDYDFNYTFLEHDKPVPLFNYGYTSDTSLFRSFVFYPGVRYASFYEVEDMGVYGVKSCAEWTSVNVGSSALIPDYMRGEFVTVYVYEYHTFQWVPVK